MYMFAKIVITKRTKRMEASIGKINNKQIIHSLGEKNQATPAASKYSLAV
jgi:hypothetical protein